MSANTCPDCGQPGTSIDECAGERTIAYECHNQDCAFDDVWEIRTLAIAHKKTDRGFGLFEFKDVYGEPCSLQDSSLATEGAIWLGTNGGVKVFTPYDSPSWKSHTPEEVASAFGGAYAMFSGRMHLTQAQAAQLLPYLQHFVDNGALPNNILEES